MTDSPSIRLQSLRKTYGDQFELQIFDFEIPANAVLALLGPTGAGKSTLMRMVAGVEDPTAGSIEWGEHRITKPELPISVRRQIAMVHQRPVLLSGSVRFNVEYGLRIRGIRDRSSPAATWIERLGLQSFSHQQANSLSGGQLQLVALARALAVQPRVLVLDEPTAHLDPAHVALVEDVIGQFQAEHRASIVWATHNLFQARRVAERAALLLNGQLVEAGPTEDLFERPKDERTADFVMGRMVY